MQSLRSQTLRPKPKTSLALVASALLAGVASAAQPPMPPPPMVGRSAVRVIGVANFAPGDDTGRGGPA